MEGEAGGVQTGVDAPFFGLCKKLCYKADLHQGFPAADCDSAFGIEMLHFIILG